MKLSILGLVAILSAAPAAIANAQTAAANTDKAIDSRIEKRISADSTLKKYDIKVDVANGVATLSGTVATEAERTHAAALAKVPGVTRVDNKIVTDLDAGTRGVKGTAGKAVDKSKDAGEKAVDKTKDGVSKTGEVITDGWITSRIKTKFMGDEALRASDVDVSTDNHIVTL